jgi:uncharacterized damage-inducible protein DinB
MDAKTLIKYWNEVRSGLFAALDKISDEQLDFKPRQELWSLRETVVHIAGTEDGWLRHYTANKWHDNIPQAGDYPTVASLKALLNHFHAITEEQFSKDPDALLEQVCQLPWGGQVGMGWAVWHVLEHEIHHRGEVYLMLGMMGIEAPDV